MPDNSPIVVGEDLSVCYPNSKQQVFSNWDFAFDPGGRYQLDLPSGSGKSTLIYVLLGALPIDSGKLFIQGANTKDWRDQEWSHWRSQLSVQLQTPLFLPHSSLTENILGWWASPEFSAQLSHYYTMLNLEAVQDSQAQYLSGGQIQKMLILKALAKPACFYLFDEPLNHQSVSDIQTITELSESIIPDNSTVLTVTHQSLEEHGYQRIQP